MSRLSNRVSKLETSHGIVDLELLQRNNPDADLSILSADHLARFSEIKCNTAPRSLPEFSNKELHELLAFSMLFKAHAIDDEAAVARAYALLDDGQEFTSDELMSVAMQRYLGKNEVKCHAG